MNTNILHIDTIKGLMEKSFEIQDVEKFIFMMDFIYKKLMEIEMKLIYLIDGNITTIDIQDIGVLNQIIESYITEYGYRALDHITTLERN